LNNENQKIEPAQATGRNGVRGRVVVVDDDEAMLFSLKRILTYYGFDVTPFGSAESALSYIREDSSSFDVILTDLNMPVMDGLELMRCAKDADPEIVIVVLTGFPSADNAISALRNGAFDFLEKPYSNEMISLTLDRGIELRKLRRSLKSYHQNIEEMLDERGKELKTALSKLNDSYMKTMEVIIALLELKGQDTAKHSVRVGKRAVRLAELLGIGGARQLETIRRGALLHDIGKIGIPDSILNKPGKLDANEIEIMRLHPKMGYDIVATIPEMEDAAEIVLSHHERFDGTGYPRRLSKGGICVGARVFSVIDTYDAIRFDRCYRAGAPLENALAEIELGAGSQFDPEIVRVFKENVQDIDRL